MKVICLNLPPNLLNILIRQPNPPTLGRGQSFLGFGVRHFAFAADPLGASGCGGIVPLVFTGHLVIP